MEERSSFHRKKNGTKKNSRGAAEPRSHGATEPRSREPRSTSCSVTQKSRSRAPPLFAPGYLASAAVPRAGASRHAYLSANRYDLLPQLELLPQQRKTPKLVMAGPLSRPPMNTGFHNQRHIKSIPTEHSRVLSICSCGCFRLRGIATTERSCWNRNPAGDGVHGWPGQRCSARVHG